MFFALEMLHTASVEAITIHIESNARYRPGQTRRPNPNATAVGSRTSGLIFPSLMDRSGFQRVRVHLFIMKDGPGNVQRRFTTKIASLPGVRYHECIFR